MDRGELNQLCFGKILFHKPKSFDLQNAAKEIFYFEQVLHSQKYFCGKDVDERIPAFAGTSLKLKIEN